MLQRKMFRLQKSNTVLEKYEFHPDVKHIFKLRKNINIYEAEIEIMKLILKKRMLFDRIVDFGNSEIVFFIGL